MAQLAPSILNSDFSELGKMLSLTEQGGADLIHMDVMDGCFVPDVSFGSVVVQSLAGKTGLPFDVHLMTQHPENIIKNYVTKQTEYITVHQEACTHLNRVVAQIHDLGCKAGVALNPATSLATLDYILEYVDMVLVMSVNPGYGGQKFIPNSVEKVAELASIREESGLNYKIEVDGGVNLDNAQTLVANGADILVVGSSIFRSDDISNMTRSFKLLIG